MLRVTNLGKYFGDQLLFEDVSFAISKGEKVGVVGPNGSGKTTLLRTIAGQTQSDFGSISSLASVTIGYVPQSFHLDEDCQLDEFLAPQFFKCRTDLANAAKALEGSSFCLSLLNAYHRAFEAFESVGGYVVEKQIEVTLREVGLDSIAPNRLMKTLSGGQRTRAALARVMVNNADLLLLDEPTNNLDLDSLEWLEAFVSDSAATLIMVSHDRFFLDRTCTRILDVEPSNAKIASYSGNYSWYLQRKEAEHALRVRQYKEQQEKILQLTQDVREVKQQAAKTENSTVNDFLRGRSKKVAAKAKAREARLNRIIEREKIERPRELDSMRLSISGREQHRSAIVRLEEVSYSIGGHCVLKDATAELIGSRRILVGGKNGSGKTTLLRLISSRLEPQAGNVYVKNGIKISYLPQHQESLPFDHSMIEYFRKMDGQQMSESSWRTFLNRFQFSRNDVFKKIGALSQGERTKLLLAACMLENPDLMILDEPTNHLDIPTIEALEKALAGFEGAMILVSHDRYFASKIKPDEIWFLEEGILRKRDTV